MAQGQPATSFTSVLSRPFGTVPRTISMRNSSPFYYINDNWMYENVIRAIALHISKVNSA